MVPATIFCTYCGTANRGESTFCFACGHPLQNAPGNPSRPFPRYEGAHPNVTGNLPTRAVLKQRYRILARVGNGGFGAVYKAEDMQFGNRLVAVKELYRAGEFDAQDTANAADAFKREAMLLANLKHPSLPSIYDHFAEAGHWYLVMDYIEGDTLETLLERMRRFRVEDVLRIGIQLCDVLNYLHSSRPPIIFRDLKPANIIMTPRGHIYLIDFGLARLFDPAQPGGSTSFGSPGYAAPEQYESVQTTVRADIYSFGATLHQMLTGNHPALRPFEFAPIRFAPGTPLADFGTLIARMLEVSPNRRPESMSVVLHELEQIANRLSSMRGANYRATPSSSPARSLTPGRTTHSTSRGNPPSLSGIVAPPIGTLLCLFEGHQDEVNDLIWSSNGSNVASASSDGTVQIWNVATASVGIIYRNERKQVRSVAWSPDGSRIAIGYSGDRRDTETVHIIQAESGECIFTFAGSGGGFWNSREDSSIYTLAWSPDGSRIAWGGGDNKVNIWDAQTRRQLVSYKGHNSSVHTLAWSPDSRQIVSGGADDAVHIWDAATGRNAATYFKHSAAVTGVVWSSNGQRIVSGSHDKTAQVWNAITGTTLTTYRGHAERIQTVAWSPDGSRIATGSGDGSVHIWDAGKGTTLFTYAAHVGRVNTVRWSPDGRRLATAGADKTIHIWRAA